MKKRLALLFLIVTLCLPAFSGIASAANSNNLSSVSFDSITFNSEFSPTTTTYTATVNSDVQQTIVRPVALDSTATVKVNGGTVASGGASNAIPLANPTTSADSTTTITITVTAQDSSSQTYTFVITRQHVPSVQSVQASAVSGTSVKLTWTNPTGRSDISSVQIQKNGSTIDTISSTSNQYTVNGLISGQSYTFQVVAYNHLGQAGSPVSVSYNSVQQSSDKMLSLTASDPLLNAYLISNFSAFTGNYTFNYTAYTTSQITFTPVLADTSAKVTLNGQSVSSGSTSSAISLTLGANTTIDIQVVLADGTQGSHYVLTVYMPASSKNALSNLTLTGATLDKSFDPAKTSYTSTVSNGISSVTITPVADSKSTIKVNQTTVAYGGIITVQLYVGLNTITITAIGEDGSTKTYTIEITRQNLASASDLVSLSVGDLKLNESFSSARYSYTADASYDRYVVAVVPTVNTSSTVKVNGSTVTSGSSYNVNLTTGNNLIRIDVTGADGTVKNYTVTIDRTLTSDTPLLWLLSIEKVITVQSGTVVNTSSEVISFNETFDPARTVYTANVPYQTSSILIRMTPYSSSYAVMNGAVVSKGVTDALTVNVGQNTFTINVYNNSKNTSTVYTIYVTRADVNGAVQGNSSTTGKKKGSVSVSGDQVVLTASSDPLLSEYMPTLNDVTNAFGQYGSSKGITFKIGEVGENRGMTNTLTLDKDVLGYLKQRGLPLRIQTDSVTVNASVADLPANSAKITVRKGFETEQQYDKDVQIIVPSVKITIDGDNKQLPMNVEIQTKLPFNQSSRSIVFQNGTRIKSTTNQDNKGAKQFKITGSSELTIGLLDKRFEDMAGHWANTQVTYMADKMLVDGYEDNTFKPDAAITRAEFVSMIVNVFNATGITLAKSPYIDVSESDWYYNALSTATSLQLVEGSDTHEFKPNEIINREEIAVIVSRLMKHMGMNVSMNTSQGAAILKTFTDEKQVSTWASASFAAAIQAGIISGTSDTSLSPKSSGSRAQTVVMLYRLLSKTNGF